MDDNPTNIVMAFQKNSFCAMAVFDGQLEKLFANDSFFDFLEADKSESTLQGILPDSLYSAVKRVLSKAGVHRFVFESAGKQLEYILVVSKGDTNDPSFLSLILPTGESSHTLKAIGEVTSKYGHDVNNLLGAIRGSADLIAHKLRKTLGDEIPVDRQLKLINSSVAKAVRLTNQMRGYARLEPAMYSEVSVNEVLVELVKTIEDSDAGFCEVLLEIQDEISVLGNSFQLSQAFYSVILNAIDAMQVIDERCLALLLGSVTLKSGETHLPAGSYMQLVCIDHGSGMEKESIEKAFRPFFSTKSALIGQGLGLGLPMARQVIQDHRGDIILTSLPDTGTAVRILLPLAPAPK